MKYFIEPKGRFALKIPIEWQYKNVATGGEEISPYSFAPYENSRGAFQISCYSHEEKPLNPSVKVQKFDTAGLEFIKQRMDGGGFNMHLWYAVVEDHSFIAKYIYETHDAALAEITGELEKAELSLATLELLSPSNRIVAIEIDKYETFMAALAASFDLKNKAIENESLIELLIITANQIDAYLRMALVLSKQLDNNTDRIDVSLLFQGESDTPVIERTIYKQAKHAGIIDDDIYNELDRLYKERNKVVHRYIITDFKTRNLYKIIFDYETVIETVRLSLEKIEQQQTTKGIGIYKRRERYNDEDVRHLYSQINDKHLIRELYRQIDKNE